MPDVTGASRAHRVAGADGAPLTCRHPGSQASTTGRLDTRTSFPHGAGGRAAVPRGLSARFTDHSPAASHSSQRDTSRRGPRAHPRAIRPPTPPFPVALATCSRVLRSRGSDTNTHVGPRTPAERGKSRSSSLREGHRDTEELRIPEVKVCTRGPGAVPASLDWRRVWETTPSSLLPAHGPAVAVAAHPGSRDGGT